MSDALTQALEAAILKLGDAQNQLSEALNHHLSEDRRQREIRSVDVPGFGVAIVGPGKHIRAATGPETVAHGQTNAAMGAASLAAFRAKMAGLPDRNGGEGDK